MNAVAEQNKVSQKLTELRSSPATTRAKAKFILATNSQSLEAEDLMTFGNKPVDGGHLLMSQSETDELGLTPEQWRRFIRRIYGSPEFIRGHVRYCLWIEDKYLDEAMQIDVIRE